MGKAGVAVHQRRRPLSKPPRIPQDTRHDFLRVDREFDDVDAIGQPLRKGSPGMRLPFLLERDYVDSVLRCKVLQQRGRPKRTTADGWIRHFGRDQQRPRLTVEIA